MKKLVWIILAVFFVVGMAPLAYAQEDGMASNLITLMDGVLNRFTDFIEPGALIGEPVTVEGVTFVPVVKVSFGFGGGGGEGPPDTGYGAGMGAGASIEPVSFLIIQDGRISLISAVTSPWKDLIMEILPLVLEGMGGMQGMTMYDFQQDFSQDYESNEME